MNHIEFIGPAGSGRSKPSQSETDDIKIYKRLTFLTRLCNGATLLEAAEDVGVSEGTASN